MAVAVNDLFLVTVNGLAYNQRIMLTLGYRVADAVGSHTEQEVSEALAAALAAGGTADIVTPYTECLSTATVLTDVWAQKIEPNRFRRYNAPAGLSGQGGPSDATNLAAVLTLQTALSGRSQQANKHIGPIPQGPDWTTEGVLTTDFKILLAALGDALVDTVAVLTGDIVLIPCIIHGPGAPLPSTDIITYAVQDTIRVMRRRTVGLGI